VGGDVDEPAARSETAERGFIGFLAQEKVRIRKLGGGVFGFQRDMRRQHVRQSQNQRMRSEGRLARSTKGEDGRARGVGDREFVDHIAIRTAQCVKRQVVQIVVRSEDQVAGAFEAVADGRQQIAIQIAEMRIDGLFQPAARRVLVVCSQAEFAHLKAEETQARAHFGGWGHGYDLQPLPIQEANAKDALHRIIFEQDGASRDRRLECLDRHRIGGIR
jgi:hypothetical protein